MKKRFVTISMLVFFIFNTNYPGCMTNQSCVCDDATTARQFTMLAQNMLANLVQYHKLINEVVNSHPNILDAAKENIILIQKIEKCVKIIRQYSIDALNNYCSFLDITKRLLNNEVALNSGIKNLHDGFFVVIGDVGPFPNVSLNFYFGFIVFMSAAFNATYGSYFTIIGDLIDELEDLAESTNLNQAEPTKSFRLPVKFEIPPGYLGAANVTGTIAPDTDSMDDGLIGILDASFEIADSLVGARSVYYKTLKLYKDNLALYKKNELLSKKNCEIYKRNLAARRTNKTEIITVSGVYTLDRDVHGGIIINADDVAVDLNGHTIFSDSRTPVVVARGKKNIVIKNGSIIGGNESSPASYGILVNKEATCVQIESVDILFCKKEIHFKE
ncbi:hypothetical protein ACFLYA_01690 [Candidatus Dependentiae bacterium]